jgi:hypothetical protein
MFCASPGKTIENGNGARVAKAKKIPSVAVTNRGSLENRIIFKLTNFALATT